MIRNKCEKFRRNPQVPTDQALKGGDREREIDVGSLKLEAQ
jgi:hypothetical protein